MAKKRARPKPAFKLPSHPIPDLDLWGTSAEERKTELRNAWLDANDLSFEYFLQWVPAHLAERNRLAGMPPQIPARRRGPLPERVRRMLADLELTDEENDPASTVAPRQGPGGSRNGK